MKPKVLIIVEGGSIRSIGCNRDIDIIINDYDNNEEDQVYQAIPDVIFKDGEAHKLVDIDSDRKYPLSNAEQLLKEHLKDINF